MREEKIKGTRVNLSAYRALALSIPEIDDVTVVVNNDELLIEIVSSKPFIARAKLEKKLFFSELKPKIVVLKKLPEQKESIK